jgi:plasmid stabilization system protein ParE
MAGKTIKSISKPKIKPKIIIKSDYHKSLTEILKYSIATFGKKVTESFYREIKKQIILLNTFPHKNPKNRFLDSTEHKTYRNIIVQSFYIVYCVKTSEIIILDIVHQSINPDSFQKYDI